MANSMSTAADVATCKDVLQGMTSEPAPPSAGAKKQLQFNEVHIRYYKTILGDHPSVTSGPPLGYGWKYDATEDHRFPIDWYDAFNKPSPHESRPCPIIPRHERESKLRSLDYSQSELAAAVRSVLRVKKSRRKNYHNWCDTVKLEDRMESLMYNITGITSSTPRCTKNKLLNKVLRQPSPSSRPSSSVVNHTMAMTTTFVSPPSSGNGDHNAGCANRTATGVKSLPRAKFPAEEPPGHQEGTPECTPSVEKLTTVDPDPSSEDSRCASACSTKNTRKQEANETKKALRVDHRRVQFSEAHVRYYETVLGDHPSCSGGPPLCLGWKYEPDLTEVISFQTHEKRTPQEPEGRDDELGRIFGSENVRTTTCPIVPRKEREKIFDRLGYSQTSVAAAVRSVKKSKRQRRTTYNNLYAVKIEEHVERAVRAPARAGAILRCKLYDISAYMEDLQDATRELIRKEDNECECEDELENASGCSANTCQNVLQVLHAEQQDKQENELSGVPKDKETPVKVTFKKHQDRALHWGSVIIRQYGYKLGDNPGSTSDGPSLTIGWEYTADDPIEVEVYECDRCPRRKMEELKFTSREREDILLSKGFTRTKIHQACQSVRRAKAQRRMTLANMSNAFAEERLERVERKAKQLLGVQKTSAKAIEELWSKAQNHTFREHIPLQEAFGSYSQCQPVNCSSDSDSGEN